MPFEALKIGRKHHNTEKEMPACGRWLVTERFQFR